MKRGDYDYHHASSNTQFLALVVIFAICIVCGLALGLTLLTSIL